MMIEKTSCEEERKINCEKLMNTFKENIHESQIDSNRKAVITSIAIDEIELSGLSETENKLDIEERSPKHVKNFRFVAIKKDRSTNKDSADISIASYNILADCYNNPRYLPDHVQGVPKSEFKERSSKIIKEIKDLNADIICLQEVDHFEDVYKPALSELGYELCYQKRKSRDDGCLIGLKKSRDLSVSKKGFLDYDLDHKYPDNLDFIRDKLALHVQILDKKCSKVFNVVNTHFYWDPKLDYVKYLQMFLLLRYMKTNIGRNEPIFLCGDLNSLPDTNTIRVFLALEEPREECCKEILPGSYKFYEEIYEDILALISPFKWEGAYKDYKNIVSPEDRNQGFPDFTSYTKSRKETLDYIFYTPATLRPLAILKIPTPNEIRSESLPNLEYPSDHLPLMAFFRYVN